ncbi:MAG: hemolysin III family protein [Candidatus Thermofonsia bacterium]|nr:MAG: hemolysin III family protein [Candidatus Thermofonsia bacterium]
MEESTTTVKRNELGYTIGEEIANSITHGIGALLSVAALTILVMMAVTYGDVWRIVSAAVYGSSLVILYLASTLYHMIQHPKAKRILRIFDHASIFVLIAGSYTPFLLVNLRGTLGWTFFGIIWGIAVVGIVLKVFFIGKYEGLATAAYIAMGWLVVFAFRQLMANLSTGGIILLIAGGITYTAGVIFYAWRKLPYSHAIWHLFVLGGSACHFFAVLFHVLPMK